jgi:hypothetical protein
MGLGEYDPYDDPAMVGTSGTRRGNNTVHLSSSNAANNNDYIYGTSSSKGGHGGHGGGVRQSVSREELIAKAAHVEDQMHSLRAVIDRAMGGGGGTASSGEVALKVKQSAEGLENWWDVKQQQDLISYQEADVYIKRAAAGLAGHRKWYASHNKRASKTITESLEELRLVGLSK